MADTTEPEPAPRALNQTRPPAVAEWGGYVGYRVARGLISPFGIRGRGAIAAATLRGLAPPFGARARVQDNIDGVRPHYDAAMRRRILRGVLDNFGRTAVEYTRFQQLFASAPSYGVDGLAHLEAAKAAAGGRMVVVSAHYGNWEAVRAVALLHGAPLAIIYRAFNNRLFDEEIHRGMEAVGLPAFRKGRAGARELFSHIRRGGGALILVDQRLGGAPLIDFMGRPAETSLAAAQLARTLRAPLLPAVATRTAEGFDVRFEPPVEPAQPAAAMAEVNRVIGRWVDERPEQWFWLHRRWRAREADRIDRAYAGPAPDDGGA